MQKNDAFHFNPKSHHQFWPLFERKFVTENFKIFSLCGHTAREPHLLLLALSNNLSSFYHTRAGTKISLSLSLSPGCVGVNVCDEILTRKRYLPTYLGAATEILLPSQQKVRLHYGKSRICFISRNDLAFVEWDAKWYLRICQGEFFRYLLRYPFF